MRISFIKQKQTASKKTKAAPLCETKSETGASRASARDARLETFPRERESARKSSLSKKRRDRRGCFPRNARGFELLITMMEKWADCLNRK